MLAGCSGLSSDDEVPDRVEGPTLVTKEQIERLPSDSPARSLFEWWRALQFDDLQGAVGYYARSVGVTPSKLDHLMVVGANPLGLGARLRLVDVETDADAATVFVLMETVARAPNGREEKRRVPRAFHMVREDGAWKLADNRYLKRTVETQLRSLQRTLQLERRKGDDSNGGADQATP